ncbi:hypothetical protein CEXT_722701 [Caerostris extrusa]|uniref:Uncharacterized protein n=1 Tax=Caerostris extrusa TaxID=172846 RepID=A0AAV4QYC9_CAEEX|nr:hypothetical protein CEXT_722701 [Caerostris extrusa]
MSAFNGMPTMPQCRSFAAKHILQSPTRDIPLVQSLKGCLQRPLPDRCQFIPYQQKRISGGVKRKSREIWRDYFHTDGRRSRIFATPGLTGTGILEG